MDRDHLVVTNDAQGEAEPRAADPPPDHENRHGQQQELPIVFGFSAFDRYVKAAHGTENVLRPGHDLAHQFGETKGEDNEINSGYPQRSEAHDRRQRGAGDAGGEDQHRIGREIDAPRRRIHADAEERSRRKRDVVGRSREQKPRGGKARIHHDGNRQLQGVAVEYQRHAACRNDDRGADQQIAQLACG